MSPTLGCYGDTYAATPNIDALAQESTKYNLAFATSPVCSPSRACLINGLIATSQGAHPMRSEFPLPAALDGFPRLLREQGFFTSNNAKTDYNSGAAKRIIDNAWDQCGEQAHWRQRKPSQPFFAIFNLMTSHQSRTMVWPYAQFKSEVQSKLAIDQRHDPAMAPIPPYYPDTPLVRKTVARFYDCVSVMDAEVGEILKQLSEDGLADNTIVFFYSDHGSGMPRHKRALFDSGMHVPLMVRFPRQYAAMRPTAPGETTDRIVCFEDFAPTVLSLTGFASLPGHMQGKPFLGKLDDSKRKVVHGHRDRVDEIVDLSRSVRDERFLYIRNFMPHLGWNQQSAWIDQGEIRQDFYAAAKAGNMTPAQRQYLGGSRPIEELYDCVEDPMNLNNLAGGTQFEAKLSEMRTAMQDYIAKSTDLGFVPEVELHRITKATTPMQWAAENAAYLQTAQRAAMAVGSDDSNAIMPWMTHENASARYWACVACSAVKTLDPDLVLALEKQLNDTSLAVQIEAANALARHAHQNKSYAKLVDLLQHDDTTVLIHAARTVELLADPVHRGPMQALFDKYENAEGDMAWFIRFTTTGYLSRLEAEAK